MIFYKHFPSKARLIAEYLRHNTVVWLEMLATATERAGLSPVERILATFDALDVSFQKPPFRGCPFVKGLASSVRMRTRPKSTPRSPPISKACMSWSPISSLP